MTRYTEGFSHFDTHMTAPVASGWSDGRVGLAPTGKAPPYHGAHPKRTFWQAGIAQWASRCFQIAGLALGNMPDHLDTENVD